MYCEELQKRNRFALLYSTNVLKRNREALLHRTKVVFRNRFACFHRKEGARGSVFLLFTRKSVVTEPSVANVYATERAEKASICFTGFFRKNP